MSIEIQCNGCHSNLRVPDEHAGKQARCPKCGTIQTIPGAATPFPSPASETTDFRLDQWYIRTPEGVEYGPVPRVELDQWVSESRLSAESRIRRATETWMPATTLYPELPSVSPKRYQSGDLLSAHPSNVYAESHRGALILILGIFGLLLTCPILSIMAWVMGAKDLAMMKSGVMDPAGRDMTRVGYFLGLFWSMICIVAMVATMVFLLTSV
ncbi:MAG: hypothetical protein VXY82_00180 [Planctomycetota bacterium]|nr:hypothetical protein [Planctomycetota bacterium]MEC8240164.1 hypothetical protein [Planctomycetota bacterium]MEC8569444.1 hypothetical protein [Planctomycetota bacterium]MEC9188823.1 hypothetical protein [Planctomycetota bacterium]MEE3033309.1 hypothetical protein [Planctomycetota bacterium]